MSKKRNRQPDANGEASDDSTESSQELSTGGKCLHLPKALNLNNIKKNTKKTGINAECSICKKNRIELSKNGDETEASELDVWICLQCGHQGCKQEKHALLHHEKPHSDSHCIAIDIQRWNIWCFKCASDIKLDHRKKTELIEFIKKSLSRSDIPPNPNVVLMLAQKEMNSLDKEKEKIYANLPKVMGLRNLGNTCFFNAVLQCLAQTPFIVKVLNELHTPGQTMTFSGGKHKPTSDSEEIELPPIEGTLDGWGNFTSILCQTLKEMQNCTVQRMHNPIDLINSFKKKSLQCMDGGQHDSHELLRHLLELVRNEDLKKYQTIILQKFGFNAKTKPDTVDASTKSQMKFYDNQLNSRLLGAEPVFRGVLVSTLVCLECHHSSQCKEPFLDLSLPVMADKPQPPVLNRRKNSGLDDTFDITGNSISSAPSKHQLKKERKAARKNRKNKKYENRHASNDASPKENNIMAENGSVLESEESDADVEDNIEVESAFPEVGESGYSSEKASAVASPVSPSSHRMHNQNIATSDPLNVPIECNLLLRPVDNSGPVQLTDETLNNINALNSPSPTDVSMTDIATQIRPSFEVDKSPESFDNENVMNTGFSTALVDYDLTSPDAPTVSPLSSSVASKDSPTSPLCSVLNGDAATEEKIERPLSRLDILETNTYTNKMDNCTAYTAEKEEENETCFDNLAQDVEEHTENTNNEKESSLCINDITSGFSRLGISSGMHQSPTRYPTKEEECSIQSCLNQFTALELMSGSNKVGCEECTARERKMKGSSTKMVCTSHTKQYLISQVPPILILHLKRFQAQRISFRKVMKPVTFSPLLDLAPVCKKNKKPRLYALYGVVEHCGSALHGGHYVAYVKTRLPLAPDDPRWSFLPPRDAKDVAESSNDSDSEFEGEAAAKPPTVEAPPGKWYYVSDSRVMEIDESSVLQKQAYLLFYERIL